MKLHFVFNKLTISASAITSLLFGGVCFHLTSSITASTFFAISGLILFVWRIEFTNPHLAKLVLLFWSAIVSILSVFFSQLLLDAPYFTIAPLKLLLASLCCLIVYLVFYLIFPNHKFATALSVFCTASLSLVNYFVYNFRGSELLPLDFLSAFTAANVASAYTFILNNPAVYGILFYLLLMLFSFRFTICTPSRSKARISSAVLLALSLTVFFLGSAPLEALHFTIFGRHENTFILNFALDLGKYGVSVPTGYSHNAIQSATQDYILLPQDSPENLPTIIAIMDEAFADHSIYGKELPTNTEILPFWNSLTENTIKGFALSTGYGGCTGNSEFEFLTGNSMAFLPSGSVPYHQYIKTKVHSMVSVLEHLGYYSIAMHPASGGNYGRKVIYPLLGFDESLFIEEYPQQKMLRDYVSDQESFEKIIEQYEKHKGEDLFLFCITIQNHGGYDYEGSEFNSTVSLPEPFAKHTSAAQYLTILNETDKALEKLIAYFNNVEEDVVIVFFGDHQPSLDHAFITDLYGHSFDTLDAQSLTYTVPFCVWANYDIDAKSVDLSSLNYLSNYVYEVAGIPLPPYNQFLSDIQSSIPAMNAYGYYSTSESRFKAYEEATGSEAEYLNLYEHLQYNNMFDKKNKNLRMFPVE